MTLSPDPPVHHAGGDLADYASLFRRRWLILLLCLVAGTGGGGALLWATPPSYTASAYVLVTPTGIQEQTNQVTSRQREALNLDTEAQIAQSAVVARKAREALKSTPGPVDVSVPPNTSVLQISYGAADPNSAAAGASAYAQAYLAHRREAAEKALAVQLETFLDKIRQLNGSLAKVLAELPGMERGGAEHTIALQKRSVLSRQIYNLTVKYDAHKTIAITPGSVISEATAPDEPSAPIPPLYLGSGFMAGLLAGVGLAWLRDRLDTRLRDARDLPRLTGVDVLTGRQVTDLAGAGAAVLLVPLPGTSSQDVARAVRLLRGDGVPVLGALTTAWDGAGGPPGKPSGGGSRNGARPPAGRADGAPVPTAGRTPTTGTPYPALREPSAGGARTTPVPPHPEPPADDAPETAPLTRIPANGKRVFPP
ncbi:YveK family protein [Planomonospora corallina]|uniref:YveK family protein n=1 Tax=Planomonospora corallina TaxID=1806052 RepID=A0ABV8I5Y9_9ACTN